MKRLLPLLLLLLSLTGCAAAHGRAASPPDAEAMHVFVQEEAEALKRPPVERYALLDSAQTDDGILYTIDCEVVAELVHANLTIFDGDLLFYDQTWTDEESSTLHLALVDLRSGALRAEATLEVGGYAMPQVWDGQLILCDSHRGVVRCLDTALQVTQEYTAAPDWNHWYLGGDGNELYQLGWDTGVLVTDLSTGVQQPVSTRFSDVFFSDTSPDQLTLSYLDLDSQMTTQGYLDLSTGALVGVPFDVPLTSAAHWGDIWLGYNFYYGSGVYYLGSDASPSVITPEGNAALQLLSPQGQLLQTDADNHLTLYGLDGSFLSACQPEVEAGGYLQAQFIWSETYGGYFFLVNDSRGEGQLLFWDVDAPAQGEDLVLTAWADHTALPEGTSAEAALYQRAAQLGEQYGVTIRIADQCDTVFTDFESMQVSYSDAITTALDHLEQALSSYPEGFFSQLRFDQIYGVEIQLVGALTAISEDWTTASYAAFATEGDGKYLVVIDVYQSEPHTICHEFSHIIDKKLSWDAHCRSDALYSEERWASLSPEGTEYSYTYTDWPDISDNELWTYFVDSYSRTFPTEDRARIMEYAIMDWFWDLEECPGIRAKLAYYSQCIRDAFDTTGWPEVTVWEAPLNSE